MGPWVHGSMGPWVHDDHIGLLQIIWGLLLWIPIISIVNTNHVDLSTDHADTAVAKTLRRQMRISQGYIRPITRSAWKRHDFDAVGRLSTQAIEHATVPIASGSSSNRVGT
eukprot:5131382-Pyramimonas_sp.AAC.1